MNNRKHIDRYSLYHSISISNYPSIRPVQDHIYPYPIHTHDCLSVWSQVAEGFGHWDSNTIPTFNIPIAFVSNSLFSRFGQISGFKQSPNEFRRQLFKSQTVLLSINIQLLSL